MRHSIRIQCAPRTPVAPVFPVAHYGTAHMPWQPGQRAAHQAAQVRRQRMVSGGTRARW